ncbi:LytR/AlgR family response regulator transcription factor [Polaribacter cellanae]|uniref:Response regulator transcription factor n=1 Tax=Polaribacter cellanae TaxID=2818493 RepID=A0A975H886_9FLAO|nr:LytTR family DNA-binding domain-containing protein [Polaribacter cellanae]QTE23774.1 response regulator transcription factor [Polaribacter cellanae]
MNTKIRTLIVEDDVMQVTLLKFLIKKYFPEIELVGEAVNSVNCIDLLLVKKPDLLLLDIHLGKEINTLEILSEIKDITCKIIIISSCESFAVKAINYFNVAGYIVKPVEIIELKNVISKVVKEFKIKKQCNILSNKISNELIAISTTKSIELLSVKDIIYLEADGKYTVFHLVSGKTRVVSKNLGEYEKILPKHIFFRIHHKYIVNLQNVININRADGNYCYLINGKSLSIAKRRQESLRNFLHL